MDEIVPADVDQLIEEARILERNISVALVELRRVYGLLGLAPLRCLDGGQQKLRAV